MARHRDDPESLAVLAALGGSLEPGEIATMIRQSYRRYVAFHGDYEAAESGTLALWTMFTHVWQQFNTYAYLLVTAPTSEAGKSKLFDVMALMVDRPWAIVDPTGPSLFYLIQAQHPTLLIDEADLLTQSRHLRTVLNAGFEAGRGVPRIVKGETVTFDVAGPKAFSGIAVEKLPLRRQTLTRCIHIPLRRRMIRTEPIAEFDRQSAVLELQSLVDMLREWALEADFLRVKVSRPDGLTDRQWDMWKPLFAIADSLRGTWGKDARGWAKELAATVEQPPEPGVQMLLDVKNAIDSFKGGDRLHTKMLVSLIDALDDPQSEETLTARSLPKLLARFGIKPEPNPFRVGGEQGRGFVVRTRGGRYSRQWLDAFERYSLLS